MNHKYSIAFYTEASSKRGWGHLIRTICFYKEFKKEGFDVKFFLDSDGENFDFILKDINYFTWNDLEKNRLNDNFSVCFIDSYEASLSIYQKLSNNFKIAVYIDDFKRLDYPKGLIVNFSLNAKNIFSNQNKKHIYLLGEKYIPIREEFKQCKAKLKEKYILIILGGTDTLNLSYKITSYLQDTDIKKVVVSNNQKTVKSLQTLKNTTVISNPTDKELATYFKNASLAISTASMSLYELNFFKIPTVILAVSPNQIFGANIMKEYGLAVELIDINYPNWLENIKITIDKTLKSSLKPPCMIDGDGTKRVVQKVKELL